MQRWQILGLAIAIVKDGKVVVSKGYGERDRWKTIKGK
jgi:CubicO group peptidase (beta-lactamase class C family)